MNGAAAPKYPRPSSVLVLVVVATLLLLTRGTNSFIVSSSSSSTLRLMVARLPPSALQATKKESSRAKGFGKVETTTSGKAPSGKPVASPEQRIGTSSSTAKAATSSAQPPVEPSKPFLQNVDDSADPEERAKALLREKYGMRSLAEQQLEAKQLERSKEQQKKLADWKAKAERGEDFDIMSILPAPVLIAIDRFLKLGTAVCTVAFVTAGILITAEAGSKAWESPLPESLDRFIVNTVEPNFTPGLFVLLGFSVSLGVFAALQLGSQGSAYKEE